MTELHIRVNGDFEHFFLFFHQNFRWINKNSLPENLTSGPLQWAWICKVSVAGQRHYLRGNAGLAPLCANMLGS